MCSISHTSSSSSTSTPKFFNRLIVRPFIFRPSSRSFQKTPWIFLNNENEKKTVPFLTTTSYMCWTSIRSTNCIFSKCTYIYRIVYTRNMREWEKYVGDARWTLNMWSGEKFLCQEEGVWDIEMMMMIPLTLNIVHEALLRRMRIGKFSVVAILTLGNRSFFHIFSSSFLRIKEVKICLGDEGDLSISKHRC